MSLEVSGPTPPRLGLLELAVTLLAVVLPWSIAASQIALGLAALAFLVAPRAPLVRRAPLLAATAFALWSLVSVLFAKRPDLALKDSKDLLLLFILVVVPAAIARRPALGENLPRWLIASGALAATLGVFQFVRDGADLLHRARGPFGHYMAFAGVSMLIGVAAVATALRARDRERRLAALAAIALVAGLGASLTRSSWLGFLAALLLIIAMVGPRLLPVVVALAAIAVMISPSSIRERALSTFDLGANADRLEMLAIGLRMIGDRPWVGVGPANLPTAYLEYQPSRPQPHLHSNLAQIAAERGIPGAILWLTLMACLTHASLKNRTRGRRLLGVGLIAAFMVAGLFEYNFGDSEVEMTFLFLAAVASVQAPSPLETA